MSEIYTKQLKSSDQDAAVEVLAHAFETNPIHVAAFGPSDGEVRKLNRIFFGEGVRAFLGKGMVAAYINGELVGVMRLERSPECMPSPEIADQVFPDLLKQLGDSGPRLAEWLATWGELHPEESHWHLGPIAVAPKMQGQGIGKRLMQEYLDRVDATGIGSYLETDRESNVEFYKKFGFAVTHEQELLGIPTWYMWRDAAAA